MQLSENTKKSVTRFLKEFNNTSNLKLCVFANKAANDCLCVNGLIDTYQYGSNPRCKNCPFVNSNHSYFYLINKYITDFAIILNSKSSPRYNFYKDEIRCRIITLLDNILNGCLMQYYLTYKESEARNTIHDIAGATTEELVDLLTWLKTLEG